MPTQYEKDKARSARGVKIATWVRKEKKAARMLAINPGSRGVAATGADVDRMRRTLVGNKGIRFDDQKVDTSNVKDLRPVAVKKAKKASPKPSKNIARKR